VAYASATRSIWETSGEPKITEGVDLEELNMLNEKRHTLDAVLGYSIRELVYEYDFADNWRRRISDEPLRYVAASKLAVESFWSFPIDPR
jgi:hypothetical protein